MSDDGDDISLLGALEAISRLVVSHRGDPGETLTNIARLIQRRFRSDVCSVYLLEVDRLHLVLAATIGLDPSSVGQVRMRVDEGLVGLVAEQLQPQVVANSTAHPRFKYFPEAGEDPYHSFLGVPVVDRGLLLGVMVVQTIEPREFSRDEVRMVAAAAAHLAPIVSDARFTREVQWQAERLKVVQITMRTVQDIVSNALMGLQGFRFEAEEYMTPESLARFDQIVSETAAKLKALGDLKHVVETEMAVGPGIAFDSGPTTERRHRVRRRGDRREAS